MPTEVILPKFGFDAIESEIVEWLVRDGGSVKEGDPIAEVTTDKTNMEVESPASGTLVTLFDVGAAVMMTTRIGWVLHEGEDRSAIPSDAGIPPAETSAVEPESAAPVSVPAGDGAAADVTPVARRLAETENIDLAQVQGTGPQGRITRRDVEAALGQPAAGGKVRATPAARRIAAEQDVELTLVAGTGPQGRVQGSDVQAYIEAQATPAPAPTSMPALTPSAPMLNGDIPAPERVELKGMRRTIATRLQHSYQTAPHIFFDAQVDMTEINALRGRIKARDEKLSVTSVLVMACQWTLERHPWLNATIDENEVVSLWKTVNIGVAVALENGLVVPVVHQVERLSLSQIQAAVTDLSERARSNKLKPEDVVDGTFTISNLGMYGVDRFTAIINPPQVAILAISRTIEQFVPDENGQPVLKPLMTITLSADHRVVDGAQAALFMQDLRAVLEDPMLLAW